MFFEAATRTQKGRLTTTIENEGCESNTYERERASAFSTTWYAHHLHLASTACIPSGILFIKPSIISCRIFSHSTTACSNSCYAPWSICSVSAHIFLSRRFTIAHKLFMGLNLLGWVAKEVMSTRSPCAIWYILVPYATCTIRH